MGLYSLVMVRSRYVGGFIVLLLFAILSGIRLPKDAVSSPLTKHLATAVMATILFSVAASLAETAYVTMTVYNYPTHKDYIRAAEGLQSTGLRTGDPVAVIGDGTIEYWARAGHFKIVAEVHSPEPGMTQFWSEPWERRNLAYECLSRSGAKVVVAWDPPRGLDPGWKQIADTNYYAYFLPNWQKPSHEF
jgi:hypothetical protein